ncbi:MAG: hypothetical protein J5656_01955 [Clostridia bacterium]|nr:hypothetical protein [Clostridia bacterium]
MEFFEKAFDAIANGAAKVSISDVKLFAIVAFSLIGALILGVGISYAFTATARMQRACRKISKSISSTFRIVNDDNVAQFTKTCFSDYAPRRLREAWIQYLGVRFGYPSEIISRERVFDREIKANRNIRSVIFIAAAFILIGVLSFFAMGTDYKAKLGVLAGIALLIVAIFHLLFILLGKLQTKGALKAFEDMQDDLDAATQLQIEKDYAADSSPLSELATIVDEIVAKNLSKDVREKEYEGQPTEPIDILKQAKAAIGNEEEEPVQEEIIPEPIEYENSIMTNEQEDAIINNVDMFISQGGMDENNETVQETNENIQEIIAQETKELPVEEIVEDFSIEGLGNAIREQYNNEQYINLLDQQIIEEDEDMFGWKRKEKKEEVAQEENQAVELEEVSTEPEVPEKVDLDQNPADAPNPDLGFDYAEAQQTQEEEVKAEEEAKAEEKAEEAPVEEAPVAEEAAEEKSEEAPAEEPKTEEAALEQQIADISAEELGIDVIEAPTEEEIKAVEELEAEEEAIDDDEDFSPPRFAKLPQLVNFICSSDKFSKSVKIKMCLVLLQMAKKFQDQPEEKIILIQCITKIISTLKK